MRHLKSANQTMSHIHLFVIVLGTFVLATSGCSKLQQQTTFKPIPQPRSLSDSEKQSVEEILQRQDQARIVAEKAAAEAAAEAEALAAEAKEATADAEAALKAEAAETSSVVPPLSENTMIGSVEMAMESDFNVAQVSFETEAEDAIVDQPTVEAMDEATEFGGFSEFVPEPARSAEALEDVTAEAITEFEAAEEAFARSNFNSVTLTANVDDLEGVPFNSARDDIDLSKANFLRPSSDPELSQISPSDNGVVSEVVTKATQASFNSLDSDPPRLPLQPMLFNPATRTRKTIVEGTLRPLSTNQQDLEPEVEVEKINSSVVSTPSDFQDSNPTPNTFGPLTPLRNPNRIKLDSPVVETVDNRAFNSRLLEPITPSVEAEAFEVPKTNFIPKEAPEIVAAIESVPAMVSEEIIVVDPTPVTQPEPVETKSAAIAAPEVADRSGYPVVDKSLSQSSVNYLKPVPPPIKVAEEAFIPAEVLEDVEIVVSDIEKELEANSIPVESFPVVDNDFKVRPTSNTAPAPIQIDEEDSGEPMFENNDFAEPESPAGTYVPPMTVVPAEVPTVEPKPLNPASTQFGGEVNLDAPPEADAVVAHVASLPVSNISDSTAVSNSKVPPVGISTLMELNAVTWKSRLDEAIELAEERLNRMNNPADSMVVNLRLLKALRGQMEQMEASPGSGQHSENESQYWQHQMEAITSMLGSPTGASQAITDYHRHQTAHKTLEHLRNAVSQLESIASLKVGSGQFCTEITGFGQFRTFASNQFSPGQKMLVYCEVENYMTIQNESATGTEFRTRLKGSFAIYDADGKVVQQAEYPTVDDIARKRRRDFYMYMPVTLGDLPSGQYVLHALVEDVHGNKTASLDPPLQFSVK